MADIIKRVLRKILPKFNIPKIIVDDKSDKEIALFGEVNTENIEPYELPEAIPPFLPFSLTSFGLRSLFGIKFLSFKSLHFTF